MMYNGDFTYIARTLATANSSYKGITDHSMGVDTERNQINTTG